VNVDKTVTATTDVVGGGKSLKSHIHTGVTSGSGTSGPPQ
jgi:phage baseplate assembly protein gpV